MITITISIIGIFIIRLTDFINKYNHYYY